MERMHQQRKTLPQGGKVYLFSSPADAELELVIKFVHDTTGEQPISGVRIAAGSVIPKGIRLFDRERETFPGDTRIIPKEEGRLVVQDLDNSSYEIFLVEQVEDDPEKGGVLYFTSGPASRGVLVADPDQT